MILLSEIAKRIYSPYEIEDHVLSIGHHTEEDIEDGDLIQRIHNEDMYELKEIPLGNLDLNEWYVDEDMVEDYVKLKTDIPPIIVSSNYSIIDGIHRANAAYEKGQKTINAYIGINNG